MAFILDLGSIIAICLILDYKGGIQPSSTTKSHKFIGIFMLALIIIHCKQKKKENKNLEIFFCLLIKIF
jgi:hypothetical protein